MDVKVQNPVSLAQDFIKKENGSTSVYKEISSLIKSVLDERPLTSTDLVENILSNKSLTEEKEKSNDYLPISTLPDSQIKLFEKTDSEDTFGENVAGGPDTEEEFEVPLPNCTQLDFYFEQAGIGLGREENYRIFLALKQLIFTQQLGTIRFWGKIFGLEKNYIIAEGEFREGEGEEEENEEEEEEAQVAQSPDNFLIKALLNIIKPHPYNVNKLKDDVIYETGHNNVTKGCRKQRCTKCGLRKQNRLHTPNILTLEEEPSKDDLTDNENDEPLEDANIPKSTWKPPPEVPKEEFRSGVNKKVYFVCNEVGEEWTKLPQLTPKEINAARSITKFFTGRLDAKVETYPPFEGTEANFLRAQIARISAGTQVSPAGYYAFDDEDEDEEDEEGRTSYMINQDFEGVSLKELSDPGMIAWVHHTQHILPQGRCSWFDINQKPEDDFDVESFDDDEDLDNEDKPETGPSLLSSTVDDEAIGADMPAWSVSLSSRVLPEYSVAVAKSNRWPGAYAFATPRKFENVYIGWGNKYTGRCFNPVQAPIAFEEYPDNNDVIEQNDPTVEEEKALEERERELRAVEEMNDEDEEDDEDDE
eukprot:TCONS_00024081-protein